MNFIFIASSIVCTLALVFGYVIAITTARIKEASLWTSLIPTSLSLIIPAIFIFFNASYILQSTESQLKEAYNLALGFALSSVLIVALTTSLTIVGLKFKKLITFIVPMIMFFLYYKLSLPIVIKLQAYNELISINNVATIWIFINCMSASSLLLGYLLTVRLNSKKNPV